jgi:hypothetical protein
VIAVRIGEREETLGGAPFGNLPCAFGRQGNRQRIASVAGGLRPGLHALAEAHAHLLPVPARVENCVGQSKRRIRYRWFTD